MIPNVCFVDWVLLCEIVTAGTRRRAATDDGERAALSSTLVPTLIALVAVDQTLKNASAKLAASVSERTATHQAPHATMRLKIIRNLENMHD